MQYQRKTKKISFWNFKLQIIIALITSCIALVASVIDWKEKEVTCNVYHPITDTTAIVLKKEANYLIQQEQQIVLTKLNFFQTFIAKDNDPLNDTVSLLYFKIILAFITYWYYKFNETNAFKTNFSKSLYWLGILLISFSIIDWVRTYYWQTVLIQQTKGLYLIKQRYFHWIDFKFLIGIILIWLHKIFKKGEQLQQENDLTI
jgi:hypothetical protein